MNSALETIKVAEHFYSIQCEGKTIGVPSVFLRLSGCKLNCVWCDTTEVWKQGTFYSLKELNEIFLQLEYYKHLKLGAHLIWTGGDPLIQQEQFAKFFRDYLGEFCGYVECETEAVIYPSPALHDIVTHYNVSPKLANSGMPEKARIKPSVIRYHAERPQDIFKFVIGDNGDAYEAMTMADDYKIPYRQVYFMPKCDTRKSHDEVAPDVVELAKRMTVNYSPRLHLQIWDRKTGV